MVQAITNGIAINVQTVYISKLSKPFSLFIVFQYHITIINESQYTVKLMRRHWDIVDSNLYKVRVDGDGVVGQQPVIEPNGNYSYCSSCNITSELGKMQGHYIFQKLIDGSEFVAEIPEFNLVVPFILN